MSVECPKEPMTTRETRVHLRASPEDVFQFLSSTAHVPLFAPGIEEAHLLGGEDRLQGAWLGLRTRSGRELRAQVTHYHENERWTVVDELHTSAQMEVEAERGGTLLTATLSGSWRPADEKQVYAEWERKLRDIERYLVIPAAAR